MPGASGNPDCDFCAAAAIFTEVMIKKMDIEYLLLLQNFR